MTLYRAFRDDLLNNTTFATNTTVNWTADGIYIWDESNSTNATYIDLTQQRPAPPPRHAHMAYIIDIKDDIVSVYEQYLYAQTPLSNLADFLVTRAPTITPRLPEGTRFINFDPEASRLNLVIERPPRLATMRIAGSPPWLTDDECLAYSDGEDVAIPVNLPYQLWLVHLHGVGDPSNSVSIERTALFFSPTPLASLGDNVLNANPIPNVFADGEVCWGNTTPPIADTYARLEALINDFWETPFNDDVTCDFHGWPFSSYTQWNEILAADPAFWATLDMTSYGNNYINSVEPPNAPPEGTTSIIAPMRNMTPARLAEEITNLGPTWIRRFERALNAVRQQETADRA